jgi:hypothetical protein
MGGGIGEGKRRERGRLRDRPGRGRERACEQEGPDQAALAATTLRFRWWLGLFGSHYIDGQLSVELNLRSCMSVAPRRNDPSGLKQLRPNVVVGLAPLGHQ